MVMTTADCARDIGVTTVTITQYIKKNYLEAMKVGGGAGTFIIEGPEWAKFVREVLPFLTKRGRPRVRKAH